MSATDDDIAADYRTEQAYHDSRCRPPAPRDGLVPRFWRGVDAPDRTTYDIVYYDKLTGRVVLRYDGADPANTRFDYGALTDADLLKRMGLDIGELVDPSKCVVTDSWCAQQMRQDYSDDDYLDDYYDPDEESEDYDYEESSYGPEDDDYSDSEDAYLEDEE